MKSLITITICSLFLFFFLAGCGGDSSKKEAEQAPPPKSMVEEKAPADPLQNKGVGPVTSLDLPAEIDMAMVEEGKQIYETMCTACHKAEQKYIGPAPKGILSRRSPEWIMNMILNPEVMVVEDPIAKQLLADFNGAPMANQNLTEEQARKVLEYFRTL